MTEIKFRAKSISDNRWIYGYVIKKYGQTFISSEFSMKTLVGRKKVWLETEVVPESVCQFTGLKDKNGVEIYDGDLYKTYGLNKIFQVFNKNGAFCGGLNFEKSTPLVWIGDSDNTEEVVENLGFLKKLEVVGNIHFNPELLN